MTTELQGVENIKFIAIDPLYPNHEIVNNVHFFPTLNDIRMFKITSKKQDYIFLNDLPDKDCEKCLGTGKLGSQIVVPDITRDKLSKMIISHMTMVPPEIEELLDEIVEVMKFPDTFKRPLRILAGIVEKDLIKNKDPQEVGDEYAKMIFKDFELKKILFCDCLLANLDKEIEEVLRALKFSPD